MLDVDNEISLGAGLDLGVHVAYVQLVLTLAETPAALEPRSGRAAATLQRAEADVTHRTPRGAEKSITPRGFLRLAHTNRSLK